MNQKSESPNQSLPNRPLLSICIVTLKSKNYLKNCLESIYAHCNHISYEIIVVDNHSEDGTLEMLQNDYPNVNVIANPSNLGYSRPMNQALRRAEGIYCAQLNPDTLVHPEAFEKMITFMDANSDVGICTPKVLNRDGTLQKQCRRSEARPWDVITYFTGLSRLFPKNKFFAGYLLTYLPEDEINAVEAVSGSCMLIRREVIDQIGYLDEDMFSYQEDTDFCFRARKAGWKVIYFPQASITHFGGYGGSRVKIYEAIYWWHKSYYLYYKKNLARDYFFLFNAMIYLLMFLKFLMAVVVNYFRKDKVPSTPKP